MIDLAQWRVSIGLWNCCQATFSRQVNGHCQWMESAVKDKMKGKMPKSLAKLFSCVLSFLAFVYLIQPAGRSITYIMPTCIIWLPFIVLGTCIEGFTFLLFFHFLLLLSGDIELNPGPKIDEKPDMSRLHQWLNIVDDWESFASHLPEITRNVIESIAETISEERVDKPRQNKMIMLCEKWLEMFPDASWQDVIAALEKINELELARKIKANLLESPKVASSQKSVARSPEAILQANSEALANAISTSVYRITNSLYAAALITLETKEEIHAQNRDPDFVKASALLIKLTRGLRSASDPIKYLIDICQCLRSYHNLKDHITDMLKELGVENTDKRIIKTGIKVLRKSVTVYANALKILYMSQDLDFHCQLKLVEVQQKPNVAYQFNGEIDDMINKVPGIEINIQDILQSASIITKSPRILLYGLPYIGKTAVCKELAHLWCKENLKQKYSLVLFCPLRNYNGKNCYTLNDLLRLIYMTGEIDSVSKWIEKNHGEEVLIIFDGWEELSMEERYSSLVAEIIQRKKLACCTVIVTSRSCTSSSLLSVCNMHIQVLGFSKNDTLSVINQELFKEHKHQKSTARIKDLNMQKIIKAFKQRSDLQLLCCNPLFLFAVVSFSEENKELPATLTDLYKFLILQAIKKQAEKSCDNVHLIKDLDSLPASLKHNLLNMSHLAYTSLIKQQHLFSFHQLQESLTCETVARKDFFGFGLMSRFFESGEEKYQFIYSNIRDFLAAFWIANKMNYEEVFAKHFADNHFQRCLIFVAGLTGLKHGSYQKYFDQQYFNLHCNRETLSEFELFQLFWFSQSLKYQSDHNRKTLVDTQDLSIFLLQLLYESQNKMLCQVLAQSIENADPCLKRVSHFEMLYFIYFLKNSNTTWNQVIDLRNVCKHEFDFIIAELEDYKPIASNPKSEILEVELIEQVQEFEKLIKLSIFHNIQEFYCVLCDGQYDPVNVLLLCINAKMKILHINMRYPKKQLTDHTAELEQCIANVKSLVEIKIVYGYNGKQTTDVVSSIIKGVTKNETIKSLSLAMDINEGWKLPSTLPDNIIEQLLMDNNTISALSLCIPDCFLPPLKVKCKVSMPLAALEISWSVNLKSILPFVKGLRCLILHSPISSSSDILESHPQLEQLTLPLETEGNATELFTTLQKNTVLKALSVKLKLGALTNSMGSSLQNMLKQNQTLEILEIKCDHCPKSFSFSPFVTENNLKHLSYPF